MMVTVSYCIVLSCVEFPYQMWFPPCVRYTHWTWFPPYRMYAHCVISYVCARIGCRKPHTWLPATSSNLGCIILCWWTKILTRILMAMKSFTGPRISWDKIYSSQYQQKSALLTELTGKILNKSSSGPKGFLHEMCTSEDSEPKQN